MSMTIEGPGAIPEKKQPKPHDVEDVAAEIHLVHDDVLNGVKPPSEKLLEELRSDVSRLEFYPTYQEYSSGAAPTLGVLTESARRAGASLDSLITRWQKQGTGINELAEEIKMSRLLAGRAEAIKWSIKDYVRTLIMFHNIKGLSHGGTRDMTERIVKIDHERRHAHESLLQTLGVMTTTILKAAEEDLLEGHTIIEWTPGMPAGAMMKNPSAIVIFSPKTLMNRDYVRDWAMAADFDEQLRDVATFTPAIGANEVKK